MRISRIEYENFRNFREAGHIDFATDGRVTIIYGKNGDGKTTMHQLMQWVFYGITKFSKDNSDILYNTKYETEVPNGSNFRVWGRITFTNQGNKYILEREAIYKKSYLGESSYDHDTLSMWLISADGHQEEIKEPVTAIEKMLPSYLKDYFFFDGEGMIVDLGFNTPEAAKRLRKALYAMLDLDVLENAVMHIGDIDHKETVLGKLFLSRGESASGSEITKARTDVERAQSLIEELKAKLSDAREEKKKNQNISKSVSEQIGASKSKEQYEKERKEMVENRDYRQGIMIERQGKFGDIVFENYVKLLISKKIKDARKKLKMKVEQTNLPDGINTDLLAYLLSEQTTECICGNPLCEDNIRALKKWQELLPPKSYALLYHDFKRRADTWGTGYDRDILEDIILKTSHDLEYIADTEEKILAADEVQKKSPDISELVTARQVADAIVKEKDSLIIDLESELRKAEIYLRKVTKVFDELTKALDTTQSANRKIAIMEQVRKYFSDKLENSSAIYSQRLQKNIQDLLDRMLNAVKNVEVSPSFEITIQDPEKKTKYKSGGQFAVASFAFIGGIYKLLQSEEGLQGKEFPLVLDAPFSKLDKENEQSVVDTIPSFAPQLILFSKDTLEDKFDPDVVGKKWTIESNAEKNISTVREGYNWN